MKCPFCGSSTNRVADKRAVKGTGEIRRRRECLKCLKRFTTYEKMANLELIVVKKDGRREQFHREKLKTGIGKALEKRPAVGQVEDLTEKIERKLRRQGKPEISSKLIGRMVLGELKRVDSVAYLRFCSVYRQFQNPSDFARELESIVS